MKIISVILISLVALLHTGFLILEMFLWEHDIGRQIFGTTPEFAAESAALAMNQGLYNGFLVAGLIWALVKDRFDVSCFFLGCVIVAGVFGSLTVKPSIFIVQALPAILALAATIISKGRA